MAWAALISVLVGGLIWFAYQFKSFGSAKERNKAAKGILDAERKSNRTRSKLRSDRAYYERVRKLSLRD